MEKRDSQDGVMYTKQAEGEEGNHWNSTELVETGAGSGHAAWTPVFNHWNSTELVETGAGSGHAAWTPVFNHWNSTELMERVQCTWFNTADVGSQPVLYKLLQALPVFHYNKSRSVINSSSGGFTCCTSVFQHHTCRRDKHGLKTISLFALFSFSHSDTGIQLEVGGARMTTVWKSLSPAEGKWSSESPAEIQQEAQMFSSPLSRSLIDYSNTSRILNYKLMDEKAQNKSTLISRLPKFGVKSPVSSSLANGACISLPGQTQGGNSYGYGGRNIILIVA
ncbi:hypothetical protein EOD39_1825 [Acipenser ruthenus]|uniref:Uncharacterized protein n=1 Tax=Acipenser ruthenus TaxID=7906 RepID=A0A444U714_ACIRT|nr:hypothetical protein EOD39_1825 [Acipenser ruthenus]